MNKGNNKFNMVDDRHAVVIHVYPNMFPKFLWDFQYVFFLCPGNEALFFSEVVHQKLGN